MVGIKYIIMLLLEWIIVIINQVYENTLYGPI